VIERGVANSGTMLAQLERIMLKYTLFKSMVGMYVGDGVVTTIPVGSIVEAPLDLPQVGIIEVRHNDGLMRVLAYDLHECAKPDEARRG
jgi:hypothetical protein